MFYCQICYIDYFQYPHSIAILVVFSLAQCRETLQLKLR